MRSLALLAATLLAPTLFLGQAQPVTTAPVPFAGLNLSLLDGTFQYGLNVSEIFQTGYLQNGDVSRQTNLSGDLAYSTKSQTRPFNAIYTGGVQITNQTGIGTTFFQSLALAQGYNTSNWNFGISDVVSYLPQSPTVGLSGIPGTGDLGLYPIEGVNAPAQSVLTYNSNRVSNSVSGNVSRHLSSRTSLSGDASYGLLHFFGSGSLDTDQVSANVSLNRTFTPRTSGSIIANYSIFSYSAGVNSSFQSRGISARVQRQVTRNLTVSAGGGPLWINSSSTLGIPSRLSVAATLNANYVFRVYNAGLSYTRGTNGGSGIQAGAITDSVSAVLFRPFGRDYSLSTNVGYAHTDGLSQGPTPANLNLLGFNTLGNFTGVYGSAQLSRRLGERFSAFVSYGGSSQSYDNRQNLGAISPFALNGIIQSYSIGISYFPRSVHLGQF